MLNALVYLVWGIASRHFGRDLLPNRVELGHIGREIVAHLRLHFPRGAAAKRYNVLQQLTYLLVVFVLFPLMILTGLTMSPGIDSAVPQLLTLFGGRQTARLIHFVAASSLVAFRHRASRDGAGLGRLEQSALDDHRLVRSRQSEDDRCPSNHPHRRDLLRALAAIGGLALSGCDRLASEPRLRSVLDAANSLTYKVQRLLIGAHRLAPEYSEADISPAFRANGSTDPQDEDTSPRRQSFADWRLKVHGLVEHELSLSLEELRAFRAHPDHPP